MAPYDTAKEILARVFPSQIFRQQASSDWQGEFSLPHPVADYYAQSWGLRIHGSTPTASTPTVTPTSCRAFPDSGTIKQVTGTALILMNHFPVGMTTGSP
jgi:hypothetical protein